MNFNEFNWICFSTAHKQCVAGRNGTAVKVYVWNEVRAKKTMAKNTTDFVTLVHRKTKVSIFHENIE